MSFDGMAPREELPFLVKRAIVQRLACYDTPTQVAAAIKEEFDLDLSLQRISYYDPTTRAGTALAEELKAIFAAARERFRNDIDAIPIANLAVRVRRLDRMAKAAEEKGNLALAAELGERAAKDIGGANTNERRHKLSGPNGEPLPTAAPAQVTIIQLPDNGRGSSGGG